MNGRNTKTITLAEGLTLNTEKTLSLPTGTPSIISMGGQCQLVVKRTGGTEVSYTINEKFNEDTGYIPKCEDTSAGITEVLSRSSTESNFSFAFGSIAEAIQIILEGTGTEVVDVYLVVGEIL